MKHEGHLTDESFGRLALGKMSTFESLNAQRHLFNCGPCLKRLIEIEVLLAVTDPFGPLDVSAGRSERKPLSIRHDTGDGYIYVRVERSGRVWIARHWGEKLDGARRCRTLREANRYAIEAFREMFPEHRCTGRCVLNPE